jgi:hypothetical protein
LGEKGAFMKIFSFTFGGLKNTNHRKCVAKALLGLHKKNKRFSIYESDEISKSE